MCVGVTMSCQGLQVLHSKGNYLYFVFIDEDCEYEAYLVIKRHKYNFLQHDCVGGIGERNADDALKVYLENYDEVEEV